MGRPPQTRARRRARSRSVGSRARSASSLRVYSSARSLSLSLYVAPLISSVRREPRNGNDARAPSPALSLSLSLLRFVFRPFSFLFFFLLIKGDVTVSSLPPRYVTDITGHRSVYPACSTLSVSLDLPPLAPLRIPLTLYPKRLPIYLTLYPTSLLDLLSPVLPLPPPPFPA